MEEAERQYQVNKKEKFKLCINSLPYPNIMQDDFVNTFIYSDLVCLWNQEKFWRITLVRDDFLANNY